MDQPQSTPDNHYTFQDSAAVVRGSDVQYQQLFEELSHALQNPLTHLKATLSLCRDRVLDSDTASQLEQSVSSLSDMARNMLSYARSSYPAARVETVCLSDLVVKVCRILEPLAHRNEILIYYSLTPDLQIAGDMRGLSEVIDNLVSNAIRFTSGCEIREVLVSLFRREDAIVLEVTDTGIGIPQTEIGLVRDRLYRASNAYSRPGTGFGLAISERIIQEHNGTLTITSTVGRGTTAQVSLPCPTS